MHGLTNRSIQCFVRDTYGAKMWDQVAVDARLGFTNFEAMLVYKDQITFSVVEAVSKRLNKPPDQVLEDIGTYLISNPNFEALRRLLRFGGVTFEEFLHSLEDMSDRARLAVPDLILPRVELIDEGKGSHLLNVHGEYEGFGHILVGVMRALADDYGALAILDHYGRHDGKEVIAVHLLEASFAPARAFDLSVKAV